jgi:hypothetical protein
LLLVLPGMLRSAMLSAVQVRGEQSCVNCSLLQQAMAMLLQLLYFLVDSAGCVATSA